MKILIYSPLFYPSIGGLQTINLILAHQFLEQGHQVKVVCTTQNSDSKNFPFEVIRYPKPLQLLNLLKWCDVYFQANVSLKGIYPLLIHPKPCVISHHGWYIRPNNWDKKTNRDTRPNNWRGWQDYLKQFVTYFVTNISVSQAVANHISGYSVVIPNSYREDIFYEIPEIHRNQELVFLGRLVSDKGANLLLEALSQLKLTGLTPKLT
ncbi:MAG: glycosyltransferase, partial [Dolichospermum sp.]